MTKNSNNIVKETRELKCYTRKYLSNTKEGIMEEKWNKKI